MSVKICRKCGIEHPIEVFYKNARYSDGRYTWCKYCFVAAGKKNYNHVSNNINAKRCHKNRKLRLISSLGGICVDCGLVATEHNSVVFDFHHRDSSQKEFTITQKLRWKKFEELIIECSKCDLLCANCHRLRHGAN